MAIVAGIDEAGLGPVLGPLVVSATVFRLPEEIEPASMWRHLASAVCRRPTARGGKVAIGDSKKLYSRQKPNPLWNLERGVLGMLAAAGHSPSSLRALLEYLCPKTVGQMDSYPWYKKRDVPLPVSVDATNLTLAGNALRSDMDRAGISLMAIRSEAVLVGQYNRHVTATNNKAVALFDITSRLLDWIWQSGTGERFRIYVDRHGGRLRYLSSLQRVLAGCSFKILDETDSFSAYRLQGHGNEGEICFMKSGDRLRLPVSLASMTSKYLRELFMGMLNDFWIQKLPGLLPTAGYYTDGRRFYGQIEAKVKSLGIDDGILYRCR